MKFGPVAPQEAIGATAVHTIRQGALVLKKGTLIGAGRGRGAGGGRHQGRSWWRGSNRATSPRTRPRPRSPTRVAGRGRACRPRLHRPRQSVRRSGGRARRRQGRRSTASTASTRRSRLRRLPAFKPVVAGEMIATVKIIPFAVTRGRARRGARGGAAKPLMRVAPYSIRKVGVVSTVLPGLATKVIEKTLQDDRRAAGAGRRRHRRRAPRAARARRAGARRSTRCSGRAPSSSSCSAPRPLPTAATSSRRRSKRSAAASSISACRSIPAISC